MLDLDNFCRIFLTEAAEQYDKTAPTVNQYINDLYSRINERPQEVRLSELMRISNLLENGIWLAPHAAANLVYHLMHSHGIDTTGHTGF